MRLEAIIAAGMMPARRGCPSSTAFVHRGIIPVTQLAEQLPGVTG
jgi:hypothetical protein